MTKADEEPPFDRALFTPEADQYAGAHADRLMEQYKAYVHTHEAISERREGANKFFLALNAAAVGAISLWTAKEPDVSVIVIACLAAIGVCYFWRRTIQAYDGLNTGKFAVIFAVERRLPLALYEAEWRALGQGRDPKRYKPLAHIERAVPVVFAALYAGIIVANLIRCLG